jgi:hypothetical protein
MPKSVLDIGYQAFFTCNNLTDIDVEEGNSNYLSIDGVLFSKNKKTLIQFPTSKEVDTYIIPKGVKEIGYISFYNCKRLTSIIIPNTVTSIDSGAFSYCTGLTNITIPSSITYILGYTFNECSNLASVTIPKSIKKINEWAFFGCHNLTTIYGYKGSYAEKYSKEYNLIFKAIE